MRDVVAALADRSGRAISVSPITSCAPLTLTLPAVDWRDALDVVAYEAGCDVHRDEAGKLTLEPPPDLLFRASGVTAAAWFELLGRTLGRPVDVAPWLDCAEWINVWEISPEAVLRASAELAGADVTTLPGGGWRLVRRPSTPAAAGRARFSPRPIYGIGVARLGREESKEFEAGLDITFDSLCAQAEEVKIAKSSGASFEEPLQRMTAHALELAAAVRDGGVAGSDVVRAKLPEWHRRLAEYPLVFEALSLQVAILGGDELLEHLTRARRNLWWNDFTSEKHALDLHVASMRRQSVRDEFRRQADRLELAGRALAHEADKLQEIDARFPIHVRAIVLDRRPGGRSRAVLLVEAAVPHEHVVEPGDRVRDASGERTPIEVVRIGANTVALSYDGVEFDVELDSSQ